MPILDCDAGPLEIRRDSALVDSNVLIAAFNPKERDRHVSAELFLNTGEFNLVVPTAAIVEAWGVLFSRTSSFKAGLAVLGWLGTPGTATVLYEPGTPLRDLLEIMNVIPLDVVDAMILRLARRITVECKFDPPIPIATFDTGDFLRLWSVDGGFRVFDMNTLELI